MNFSSATSPELLLKTFDHYCEYRRTPNGVILSPIQLNKWLVLFCDEINLPNMDKYGRPPESFISHCNVFFLCKLFVSDIKTNEVFVLKDFKKMHVSYMNLSKVNMCFMVV